MEQARAQTSLAGLGLCPTATSGARNSGGVPNSLSGAESVRKAWSKSMMQMLSSSRSRSTERKSRAWTIYRGASGPGISPDSVSIGSDSGSPNRSLISRSSYASRFWTRKTTLFGVRSAIRTGQPSPYPRSDQCMSTHLHDTAPGNASRRDTARFSRLRDELSLASSDY
jgi:hypothetical protein